MLTATSPPALGIECVPAKPGEDQVKREVRQLLGRLFPAGLPRERRHDGRYPFPFLVKLTPVDPRTLQPVA
jgi:hypothetical protein